ncbi:hypothetical protein SKAU_G00216980 [Synaphobranchus kaupii]|uniref:Uncharacterized protein n=1 Tax=Synaphobranchus kaupii TaxID=118154 RepID=A0A9Q1FA13_SYNKA|nr:hypothetical protein SKAU_G00216980 [Synaphobranchus kaupii]
MPSDHKTESFKGLWLRIFAEQEQRSLLTCRLSRQTGTLCQQRRVQGRRRQSAGMCSLDCEGSAPRTPSLSRIRQRGRQFVSEIKKRERIPLIIAEAE